MAAMVKIGNGPGKWDLMVALFDGDSSSQKKVTFWLECEVKSVVSWVPVEFCVNSVGREDGSGESWLISGNFEFRETGWVVRWENGSMYVEFPDGRRCYCPTHGNRGISGYYSTKTRKGHLNF